MERLWAEDYLGKATVAWVPKGGDPRVTGVLLRVPEKLDPATYRLQLESRVTAMWVLDPVGGASEIRRRLPWDLAAMVLAVEPMDVGEILVGELRDHLTGLVGAREPGQPAPGTKHLSEIKAVGFREWVALVLPETD
jgi:hypothetical protein